MKIQTLFHRAERPARVALAGLSTAFTVILLGAVWFQPAHPEMVIRAHTHPAVVHPRPHPRVQPFIVASLVQIIEQAI
jgi:hypothetical protein